MKMLLPELIPDVLHGPGFRRMGRQAQEPHILGDLQGTAGMPSGPIQYHDDVALGMAVSDLIKKQLQAQLSWASGRVGRKPGLVTK